ncbi:hypothetical protein [Thalassolituus oleivorans]|uniref:hypothetical protein n=1 Tax=Thalassolituus oleivorans TaxID=187493 RepID=UPI00042DBADD|nr:hypothetical protein [Thalassolituus oleivorans]AHK17638.1 hypothetical protein R615_10615 [Thalassolituus oleivorans R6-15]
MASSRKKKEVPDHVKLLGITDRYLVDLECLREMFSTVIPVLREQDDLRHKAVKEIFKRAEKVSEEETQEQESSALKDSGSDKLDSDSDSNEVNSPKKSFKISFGPKDAENLISNVRKIKRAETLFAKQSIVSFVSRFDEFLGAFLEIALAQNPDWLKSSEKTITYKQLIELKSIDTAIKGVIAKEVENLLRGSHEEHISYIDEKLKLGIRDHFPNLSCFLEVAERRNLFVHTGGQVSNQYLDRCRGFKYPVNDIKEGQELEVSDDYFEKAFNVFFEIGLRIGQAAFRRLFPDEVATADSALNKLAIKFLNYGDNELAELITNYELNIPQKLRSDDSENEYYARINRAIAQKRQGKDFEPGLDGVPWKAFHSKYKLCLHVLRDELQEAAALMSSDDVIDEVGIEGFRTWPVFQDFRSTEEFREAYKQAFDHEYTPDPERDAQTIARQEEVVEPEPDTQKYDGNDSIEINPEHDGVCG